MYLLTSYNFKTSKILKPKDLNIDSKEINEKINFREIQDCFSEPEKVFEDFKSKPEDDEEDYNDTRVYENFGKKLKFSELRSKKY